MNKHLFSIQTVNPDTFYETYSVEYYSLLLFRGEGCFVVDDMPYRTCGNTLLFLSPYQSFHWQGNLDTNMQLMQFHGDFYCIEYHKKEVACNGLLFNNIYLFPYIEVNADVWNEITSIVHKMEGNGYAADIYSEAIIKTYLQLILALSSKAKAEKLREAAQTNPAFGEMNRFQTLIEENFIAERNVSFYASFFSLTTNAFSKKIKKEFGKTPSQLILERVILEAKKRLHLTYKSVKEIAAELNFEDEFYFSRYFKKNVGFSPLHYRKKVGISIAAQ